MITDIRKSILEYGFFSNITLLLTNYKKLHVKIAASHTVLIIATETFKVVFLADETL